MGRTSDAKEKIIESAIELIGSRSYNAVGVQELCDHAGVKKGSFYHFFPSKRELTIAALDQAWSMFKTEFLNPIFSSDMTAEQKLNTLLQKSHEYQVASKDCKGCVTGCAMGNLALELSTQDESIRLKIEEIFEDWAQYFENLVFDGIQEGFFPSDTDPKSTSQAILAYIEGIYLIGKTFNDPELISRLSEGVLQLCIKRKKIKQTV